MKVHKQLTYQEPSSILRHSYQKDPGKEPNLEN